MRRENAELSKWLARIPDAAPAKTPKHLGGHLNVTHTDEGALRWLKEKFGIRTMLDIGCGPGGMERVARDMGIEWTGIYGDPQVAGDAIITHDYAARPLRLNSADLAWSVEFLEHVAADRVAHFMATFSCARHAFITHALPGKRGWHHVNCRPAAYWVEVFGRYGFAFDEATTHEVRQKSTMKRNFARENGLVFSKSRETAGNP